MWPVFSRLLNRIARFTQRVSPASSPLDCAILIEGNQNSFEIGRVAGQDLTRLTRAWLTETLGFRRITSSKFSLIDYTQTPDVIVVTYDWTIENHHRPISAGIEMIRAARRLKAPVFVMLPDGFWLTQTALASAIVAFCGGSQILLQDRGSDHAIYGTVNPSWPHFWTWPGSHLRKWRNPTPFRKRENIAWVAKSGGGEYRREVMPRVLQELEGAGFSVAESKRDLNWEEYIALNLGSKIVVTTCLLQSEYKVGPYYYQKRLPHYVITGRVWEAFASERTLLTDPAPGLVDLGFFPMEHFVPLPGESSEAWARWELPPSHELERIARNGHQRFVKFIMGLDTGNP